MSAMSSSTNSSSSKRAGLVLSGPLQDVVCRVEIVLGTGRLTGRECLALGRGAVIGLSQPAGSDLQVRVNGVPIAAGEVVASDDRTSIRVTEILPAAGTDHAK